MNTIKTLVLVALITFSSQVTAFTGTPGDELRPISQQIQTFLNYSEMVIHDDIIVTVKFKLNENNEIIVISNDSENIQLTKFIKKRLNQKELSIDKKSNKSSYSVPIRFLSTVN
ncbi:MAG: hypothetical protein V7719_15205 [Psychroserpens sp.]|uniref:hypothetical protein n=1 Tax=Psychroserpens sp. TaxID=2020870 RepID=UPI003002176C